MIRRLAQLWRLIDYWVRRIFVWHGRHRPQHMFRSGRDIDKKLDPGERLYLRCKEDWIDNASIRPAFVHFPDQSVNREKYSKPGDVLLPDQTKESQVWIYWGVARFRVEDLPGDLTTEGGVNYTFPAEHNPLWDNYAHTELRVYKNGIREMNKKKINQKIKKEYRIRLAFRTHVSISPLA